MRRPMTMLPDEEVIARSDRDIFVLTNHRLRYEEFSWGKKDFASMTLESLASCKILTRSFPILLVLAVLALLFAVYAQSQNGGSVAAGALLLSIIFVIIYLITRQTIFSVMSYGGDHVTIPIASGSYQAFIEFVDLTEQARIEYQRRRT